MVFYGMSTRTKFPSQLHKSTDTLKDNYDELEANFTKYFGELVTEFKDWK